MIDKELKYAQSRLVNQTELRAQKKTGRKTNGEVAAAATHCSFFFLLVFFY
jgi:hypothetical protein